MSKSKEHKVRFGVNEKGEPVSIDSLDINTQVGLACNLTCPKCHQHILSKRNLEDKKHPKWWYYSHQGQVDCDGRGESAVHIFAKELLKNSIGERFVLPPVSLADAEGHTSRFDRNGVPRGPFEEPQPLKDYPDRCWEKEELPDKLVCEAREVTLVGVDIEHEFPKFNRKADAYLTFQDGEKTFNVAFEIRFENAKSTEDVALYKENDVSVIEVLVRDVENNSEDYEHDLKARLFGTESAFQSREWLYCKEAVEQVKPYRERQNNKLWEKQQKEIELDLEKKHLIEQWRKYLEARKRAFMLRKWFRSLDRNYYDEELYTEIERRLNNAFRYMDCVIDEPFHKLLDALEDLDEVLLSNACKEADKKEASRLRQDAGNWVIAAQNEGASDAVSVLTTACHDFDKFSSYSSDEMRKRKIALDNAINKAIRLMDKDNPLSFKGLVGKRIFLPAIFTDDGFVSELIHWDHDSWAVTDEVRSFGRHSVGERKDNFWTQEDRDGNPIIRVVEPMRGRVLSVDDENVLSVEVPGVGIQKIAFFDYGEAFRQSDLAEFVETHEDVSVICVKPNSSWARSLEDTFLGLFREDEWRAWGFCSYLDDIIDDNICIKISFSSEDDRVNVQLQRSFSGMRPHLQRLSHMPHDQLIAREKANGATLWVWAAQGPVTKGTFSLKMYMEKRNHLVKIFKKRSLVED